MTARIDAALTQKELAERSGIDRSDISKIEHGLTNPSVKTLRKIADACGLELRIDFVDRGVNDMPEHLQIRYFEDRRKRRLKEESFKVRRKKRIEAERNQTQTGAQKIQTNR